jgi:hypothetical protein
MAAGHVWPTAENVALTGIRTRIPKRLAIPTSLARPTKHKCRKLKCRHMKVMGSSLLVKNNVCRILSANKSNTAF